MRRLFVFLVLIFIITCYLWWGRAEFGRLPGEPKADSYSPGLYLVDTGTLARIRSLPGLTVGGPVSDNKVLVRAALPVPTQSGIELEPYEVPRIAPELKTGGGEEKLVLTIVVFTPADKQEVVEAVLAGGGTVLKGIDEEGSTLRVELPAAALAELGTNAAVLRIEPYTPPRFLSDRAAAVTGTAPSLVPGFITLQGLLGSGQMVGVADSGLDKGDLNNLHPDFQSEPGKMPKVVLLSSWAGGSTADTNGHGTHVAGVIAGTGAASGGLYRGIAPGASLYFQAITNAEGEPDPPADLVTLFRPAYNAGVRVHVDGWGGGSNNYTAAASQIDRFCFYTPDFLPIFGAGNSGPVPKTLTGEANSKNALVVGASENPRPLFGYTGSDAAARLSGRGPTADGRIKPDLLAPGVGVIAPRSRAVSGTAGENLYVRQDGTSMAAAVAGGAALLLREYLRQQEGVAAPQAALLKALLINGARRTATTADEGFGHLDFIGTVLALKERTFSFRAKEPGLGEGEREVYDITVRDGGTPLKVTLAWTDPQALAGAEHALINDLDLIVEGPDGRRYLGNDSENRNSPDRLNNVEQVNIAKPAPGRYRITVIGAKVGRGFASDGRIRQPYSLVFGQPLKHEVVNEVAGGELRLDGGTVMRLPPTAVSVFNGKKTAPEKSVGPGTDVYFTPGGGQVYTVSQKDLLAPARFLSMESGTVVTSETAEPQHGGFLLRTTSVRTQGREVPPSSIPAGVRAIINLNPSTQKVWKAEAFWVEREGFLEKLSDNKITLIGGASYELVPGYTVAHETDQVGLDPLDQVFGPIVVPEAFPAGVPVKLRLDPGTQNVLHVAVRQGVVTGFVRKVAANRVWFSDGRTYSFFPGARVLRGTADEEPKLLMVGEHITGIVLAQTGELLQARVDAGVVYGQMLYAGVGGKTLYLQDSTGNYRHLELAPGAGFFRGTVNLGPAILGNGQWVRLTLDASGRVLRVDIGGETYQTNGIVQDRDPDRGLVYIGETTYRVSPGSMIVKNSFPVDLEHLMPGENVSVTFWKEGGGVPVALAIRSKSTGQPPLLKVSPPVYGKPLSGRTAGTHLYLYTNNKREPLKIASGGEFSHPLDWTYPSAVRLVAVDEHTGGVSGVWVELPSGPRVFKDIAGHWAAENIAALAAEGLLAGYPDGNFRPERTFTRAEFAALMVRFTNDTAAGPVPPDAPLWAREAIQKAVYNDILALFPDGSFRPGLPVDRATVAKALSYLLSGEENPRSYTPPPYRDWAAVPDRAKAAVAGLYAEGIMRGRSNGMFAPLAPLTRAEAAAVFYRVKQARSE